MNLVLPFLPSPLLPSHPGSTGHVIAPCTHDLPCPMSQGKWCHFKQRLQRPLSLKSAKTHATLDWEDEPFSFLAFGKKGLGQQQQQQQGDGEAPLQGVPKRPLLEGQELDEGEWGWGRVLWPTIHVRCCSFCCCCCCGC
jgi:hypothetical protein